MQNLSDIPRREKLIIRRRKLLENVYELAIAKTRNKLLSSYYNFFVAFWEVVSPDEFVYNWHIEKIADELQIAGLRLARKEPRDKDIIINIPPGESKSTLVTICFPVWLWLHNPSLSVINSSYSSSLSVLHSRKSKDIVKSELFKILFASYFEDKFGRPFILTKDNENYWENNFGGFRLTTSTNGTVTGLHGDLILRDDPINPLQAESEAYRTKSIAFNNYTLAMRKRNKKVTLTITVMQRLHKNDQTGDDLKKNAKEVHLIRLPAEQTNKISPQEWKKYYIDGLLDPRRLSRPILEEAKMKLGTTGYAGQFLQDPVAAGGNIIKEKWFKTIPNPPDGIIWDMFTDTAYTENTKNDPTGFLIVGDDVANNRIIVRYFDSRFLEMPDLLKQLPEIMHQHGCRPESMAYVEPKASGITLVQLIKTQTTLNIITIRNKLVQASKRERANYIAPFAEAGRIVLVEGGWNSKFTSELAAFPNGEHDEAIDLLAYACRKYLHTTI